VVGAAIAEYRLEISGDINRMIATAINADPRRFWEEPDA